jgi:hypothetical protein
LFVGVGLEAAALLIGGFGPTEASSEFNPLLTSAGLASWIALGMVAADRAHRRDDPRDR